MSKRPQVEWEQELAQLSLLPAGRSVAAPRYLAVALPAFPIERLGHGAQEVAVVVAPHRGGSQLVACTPAARERGITPGMPLAVARGRSAELVALPWSTVEEEADRQALVRVLSRLCDRVRAVEGDVLLFEISAVTTLYGGEVGVIRKIRSLLEMYGHLCHAVVADHPRAAWALARTGEPDRVVPVGEGAAVLADRPLSLLGPSPRLGRAMSALGIRTVGAFADLDPASVAGRHGQEGAWLHAVARGRPGPPWGQLPPAEPPPPILRHLSEPVGEVTGLLEVLRGALEDLQALLRARGERCAELGLSLDLDDGTCCKQALCVARPTRDPQVWWALWKERLGRTVLSAPVVGLRLRVHEPAPDTGIQLDLHDDRGGQEAWDLLCARLEEVLGAGAVGRAVLTSGWLEEDRWEWISPGVEAPREPSLVAEDPVELQEGAGWQEVGPRPTRLRSRPWPVEVQEDHQGRPRALKMPGSSTLPLTEVRGPEVIEDGWWRPEGPTSRQIWSARTPRGQVWLYQQRDRWWLAGWFD